MSTLANRKAVRAFYLRKRVVPYIIVTLACIMVSFIYSQFSHGVSSFHMTYLFIYPLIFGVGAGVITALTSRFKPLNFFATHLYHTGIVAVMLSSLLRGVFEIAGTASVYENILLTIGIALMVCAIMLFFTNRILKRF